MDWRVSAHTGIYLHNAHIEKLKLPKDVKLKLCLAKQLQTHELLIAFCIKPGRKSERRERFMDVCPHEVQQNEPPSEPNVVICEELSFRDA